MSSLITSGLLVQPCSGAGGGSHLLSQQQQHPHRVSPTNSNMLSSLKHRLSRKEKVSTALFQTTPEDAHLQASARSPATRRAAPTPTEAPPAYTAVADPATSKLPTPSSATTSDNSRTSSLDDPYAFLRTFDTVFLIDDSGSMAGSRWRETAEALEAITPICTSHDADGIDVHFLNSTSRTTTNIRTAGAVRQIFSSVRPSGSTPTGQRLSAILRPYIARYTAAPATTKPLNLICITDGAASDDVESVVVWAARALDRLDAPAWQVGVQFFQVGRDREAARDLAMLDDELAGLVVGEDGKVGVRDIVDTVPFKGAEGTRLTGDGILKVVLGAVNRRLDRKKVVHS